MALTPRHTTYGDSYGREDNGQTPRPRGRQGGGRQALPSTDRELVPIQISSPAPRVVLAPDNPRIDYIENRLANQEHNLKGLMDKALKIKEDIIESLNFNHGTWHEEKYAREMLQEHIRTITAVVKRMGRDIEILEEQLRNRDVVHQGASSAVKNLEMHHIAGQTDLRGRVARCDASLSRLSADIKACNDNIKVLALQVTDNTNRIYDRFQSFEQKLSEVGAKIEKVNVESTMQIKHVEGDSSQQLSLLDVKTRGIVEDLRNMIATNRVHSENEREKMETRILNYLERSNTTRDNKADKFEKIINEWIKNLNERITKLEDETRQQQEKLIMVESTFDHKLTQLIENNMKKQKEEHTKLKLECREGFSTVHDSIGNMKTVMDGKRRLLEEQLKREINSIKKMVVLV